MRVAALLVGMLVLFTNNASAQFFCSGCGCKGGSGWRHDETGKCIGCDPELTRRCGNPAIEKCTFEGQPHIDRIRRNCGAGGGSTPVHKTRPLK
jgi:hypothetical protein